MWRTPSCPPPPGSGDRLWLERCVSVACALVSYPLRPERFIRLRCIFPDDCAPPPPPTPPHSVTLQWYERAEGAFIHQTTSILGKHSTQLSQITITKCHHKRRAKTVTAKPSCNCGRYWTAIMKGHILLFLWWMLVSYLKLWICQLNLPLFPVHDALFRKWAVEPVGT